MLFRSGTMKLANTLFVAKNIPVLIGEFGVENHAASYTDSKGVYQPMLSGNPTDSILSLNSRAHFFRYLVQKARANGVSTFLWAGVINRGTGKIDDKRALDSLRVGAGY